MHKRTKSAFSKLFQSRIFLILLVLITVLSSLRLANEVTKRSKINSEIDELKQQIADLENQHDDLSVLIDKLNTDQYIEEQARKQLNLTKPGERVVIVSDSDTSASTVTRIASTPELWWNYFFK